MIAIRLYEWALQYVKNKDLIFNNIVKIKEDKDMFLVEYKNKKTIFLIKPVLDEINNTLEVFKKFNEFHPTIVLLNTKKNLDLIIDNWKKICEFHRFFCIIFANPDSELETKWIVFPHTHSLISDEASLKPGLKTMAETVDQVNDSDVSNYA